MSDYWSLGKHPHSPGKKAIHWYLWFLLSQSDAPFCINLSTWAISYSRGTKDVSSVEHPTVHFLCHFKTYRLLFFFRYDSNARYRIVLYKNCVAVSNWTNISAIKQAQYVTLSWLPIFAFWKHSTMLQNHRQMSYCNSKLNHSDHRHVLPVAQQVSFLIKLVRIDLV